MRHKALTRYLAEVASVVACCYATGKLGLVLAVSPLQISPIWLPSGLALGALLLSGPRLWPAVTVSNFLLLLPLTGSWAPALVLAGLNTVWSLLTYGWLRCYAPGFEQFNRVTAIGRFCVVAALTSLAASACEGLFLWAAAELDGSVFWSATIARSMGNMIGILVATPLVLSWSHRPVLWPAQGRVWEAALMLALLAAGSGSLFGRALGHGLVEQLPYLLLVFLAWAALRFGLRGVTAAVAVLTSVSLWFTWLGLGPFAGDEELGLPIGQQLFTGVMAAAGLAAAAVVSRRRETEAALRAARDELEQRVQDRTAALQRAKEALEGDVRRRRDAEERLRNSETLYHSLVETLPQNIFRKDLEGRFTFANQRFCQTTGRRLEEILGRTDGDLFPAHLAEKYRRDDRRILDTGQSFETVEEHQPPDGSRLFVQVVKTPLRDANGQIIGVQGIFWDITQARLAEEQLRRNEARLQALVRLNQMSAATAKQVADCALEEAVRLTRSKLGYLAFTSDDQTTLHMYAWSGGALAECAVKDKPLVYPVEDTGLWGEAVRQRRAIITNDYAAPNPWKRGMPEGHVPLKRHVNVPIFEGPRIVAVVGVGNKEEPYHEEDVTQLTLLMEGMWTQLQRTRAEQALRESEASLAAAQRITHLGSWEARLLDLEHWEHNPLQWSAEVFRIFGYEPGQVAPSHALFLQAVHPEDRPRVVAAATATIRDGKPYDVEHRILRPDGTHRNVREQGEVVRDEATGQPQRLVGTVQDLTERKGMEEQLRQAQKMEAVGQLAGGVAHDFNNLLTVIKGHLGLLLADGVSAEEARDSLREVEAAADRAATLTRQLLAFSRRQVLQIKRLDLNEVVANIHNLLHRLLGEHIALECQYAPSLPSIEADLSMIEQVLINLAVNARDAMPGGGRLILSTSREQVDTQHRVRNAEATQGQYVILSVADTGCGMDRPTLNRVFEPFFTTKDVGKGTGLGLATVYGIVKQHKGWVEVESRLGQGSCFKVYLPANGGSPAADTRRFRRDHVPGGRESILLVEDEAPVRRLARACLSRYGYEVIEAANGVEALRLWQEHEGRIDLLLTDMVMPEGLTGRDLAERLRGRQHDLRVIYSSGYSIETIAGGLDLVEGLNYLPKPYDPATLAKTVRTCLEQA